MADSQSARGRAHSRTLSRGTELVSATRLAGRGLISSVATRRRGGMRTSFGGLKPHGYRRNFAPRRGGQRGAHFKLEISDFTRGGAGFDQKLLRACLKIEKGPAARDFGCGRGGEVRASPRRAVRAEPTKSTGKRPAARRVFAARLVWRRCSSLTDP